MIISLLRMAIQDLRATWTRALVSAVGIFVGVTILLIVVGLGLGARDVVLAEVVQVLPVDMIEVIPRTVDLGVVEIDAGKWLGANQLNESSIKRLQQLDGVKAVYPKIEIKLPMGARGGARLFGHNLYTDLFVNGLPEALIQLEVGSEFRNQEDFIPVVISDQLINIYNVSVASALGTPRLTAETLTGFEFEVIFGKSLMLGRRGAHRIGAERARIVGVSRYALRLGATIPSETARRLLKKYATDYDEKSLHYSSVLLQAESPQKISSLTRAIQSAGFAVDETAEQTSNILMIATMLASTIGLLVLILAAVNIAHNFFSTLNERRRELAVLRAVGARKIDLVSLVLMQALILGCLGGIVGTLLAKIISTIFRYCAQVFLSDFPFQLDRIFVLPWWLNIMAIAAAIGAAILGALGPALKAAQASVARNLSEV